MDAWLHRWFGDGTPRWRWWAGMAVILTVGWSFIYWNEYESPWGRDFQAAKIEMMKKRLCR